MDCQDCNPGASVAPLYARIEIWRPAIVNVGMAAESSLRLMPGLNPADRHRAGRAIYRQRDNLAMLSTKSGWPIEGGTCGRPKSQGSVATNRDRH